MEDTRNVSLYLRGYKIKSQLKDGINPKAIHSVHGIDPRQLFDIHWD